MLHHHFHYTTNASLRLEYSHPIILAGRYVVLLDMSNPGNVWSDLIARPLTQITPLLVMVAGANTHGNRRHNRDRGGRGRGQASTNFRGENTEMIRYAFETHADQIKRGKFQDTLNMLKYYFSTNF